LFTHEVFILRTSGDLVVPWTRQRNGDRAFSVAAPRTVSMEQAAGRAEAAAVVQYFSSSTRDVIFSPSFYPRDDILARVRVLAMARCLCLSVTSWCSTKTAGRIELMFGMEPDISSISVRVCFNEIQIPVVLNSGLTKFRHGLSIV